MTAPFSAPFGAPFGAQSRHRRHAAAAPGLWRRIGDKVMASPRGLKEYVEALPAGLRTESVQHVFVHIVGRPHADAYATQAPTVIGWAATQGVDLREAFDEIAGSASPPGISSAWPAGFEQRPAPGTADPDLTPWQAGPDVRATFDEADVRVWTAQEDLPTWPAEPAEPALVDVRTPSEAIDLRVPPETPDVPDVPGPSETPSSAASDGPAPSDSADEPSDEPAADSTPQNEVFAENIAVLQQTVQQQGEIIARQDATLQNYHRIITDQAAVIDRQAEQLQRNEELILRMDQRLTAQDELLARTLETKTAAPAIPAARSSSPSTSRGGRHARPDAGVAEDLPNLPLSEEESQRTVAVNARAQRTLAAIRARKAVVAPQQRTTTDAQLAQRRVVARHPVQHPY
jgi:hypothetical protein